MLNPFAFAPRAVIVALQHLERRAEPGWLCWGEAPLAGLSGIPEEWGAAGCALITSAQLPSAPSRCKGSSRAFLA